MPTKFDACHAITAKWEGGWSDHPLDPGGKTKYGITQATLSAWLGRPATVEEVRNLTVTEAKRIYAKEYWARVSGDALPAGIDLCVYDFAVNSGPARAVKSLQAALGLKADGWVGDVTLKAALSADPLDLIDTLCARRLAFMKKTRSAGGEPLWPIFGGGWSRRVDDVHVKARAMAAGTVVSPPQDVPKGGTAKALPAPPADKTLSPEQKIGAGAAAATATLGPIAAFWRDNKDLLTDPVFLAVAGVLVVVVLVLVFHKPKSVEAQS